MKQIKPEDVFVKDAWADAFYVVKHEYDYKTEPYVKKALAAVLALIANEPFTEEEAKAATFNHKGYDLAKYAMDYFHARVLKKRHKDTPGPAIQAALRGDLVEAEKTRVDIDWKNNEAVVKAVYPKATTYPDASSCNVPDEAIAYQATPPPPFEQRPQWIRLTNFYSDTGKAWRKARQLKEVQDFERANNPDFFEITEVSEPKRFTRGYDGSVCLQENKQGQYVLYPEWVKLKEKYEKLTKAYKNQQNKLEAM